jgi:hypothetical protein
VRKIKQVEDIKQEMSKRLKLNAWKNDTHYEVTVIGRKPKFSVDYLWFANILYYESRFYIGFVKMLEKEILKQKIIIAIGKGKHLKFLPVLELSDYQDPIIPSLNCLNLSSDYLRDYTEQGFVMLDFTNGNVDLRLYLMFFSNEESIRKVQDNILIALKDFLLSYKDDSLLELLVVQEWGFLD